MQPQATQTIRNTPLVTRDHEYSAVWGPVPQLALPSVDMLLGSG